MTVPLAPIWLFVVGSSIGSFLNVVILRWIEAHFEENSLALSKERGDHSRSRCPHCHKTLRWWELLPLLSFILLRARCARCGRGISVQYPLVELSYGLIVLVLSLRGDYLGLLIAALLLILFVIDLKTFLLPDIFVGLLLVAVLAQLLVTGYWPLTESIYGAAVGAGFLGLLWLLTRGKGIGLGDVKLMIPVGLLFGLLPTVALLLLAFVLGGALGSILLLRGTAGLKTAIPFGPFLAGVALTFLVWPELPRWLLQTIYGL